MQTAKLPNRRLTAETQLLHTAAKPIPSSNLLREHDPPMTAEAEAQAEPTMEEILASIRKIIASDKPEEAPVAANDESEGGEQILELTEVVADEPPPAASAEPEPPPPAPEVIAMTEPEVEAPAPAPPADDALVSTAAAAASASVFAGLERQYERQAMPAHIPVGDGCQTLEGLVTAIMRPMLKDWLDQNLPATVEKLVQREIDRIAKAHRD